ncbi:MAG: hypothetical protein H6869_06265 [Rhodospirillales bacterium]|nr:hypothetical protein [Rhodospirillales bacterium]
MAEQQNTEENKKKSTSDGGSFTVLVLCAALVLISIFFVDEHPLDMFFMLLGQLILYFIFLVIFGGPALFALWAMGTSLSDIYKSYLEERGLNPPAGKQSTDEEQPSQPVKMEQDAPAPQKESPSKAELLEKLEKFDWAIWLETFIQNRIEGKRLIEKKEKPREDELDEDIFFDFDSDNKP